MRSQLIRATIVGLIALGAMCASPVAHAESAESLLRRGNQLYDEATHGKEIDEDKLKDAIEVYKEALRREPTPLIKYNLGTAQARLREYQAAQQTLSEAAGSPDGVVKQNSNFNLGIATAKPIIDQIETQPRMSTEQMEKNLKKLDDTLKSFRSVIVDAPNDNEAVYNFEVTKNAYDTLKKRMQSQTGQNGKNQPNQNNQQQGKQGQQQNQQNQQGQGKQNQQGQQKPGQQGQQKPQGQQDKEGQGQSQGQQGQQKNQQGQQGQQGQQQNQQGQQGQQQNQQGKQGQQGQQQNQQGQQGQQQNQQNQQGKQGKQGQQQNQQGQQQQTQPTTPGSDSKPMDGQRSDGGLEQQARQKPAEQPTETSNSSGQESTASESGRAGKPLTPEQMNAMSVLNMLEKERPDQYKRLFQFHSETRKLKKDW